MSFTADTLFQVRNSNDRNNDLANVAGRYQVLQDSTYVDADCSAGTLVVANGKLPCEGFSNTYNENGFLFKAADTTTNANAVVYACNPHDAPMAQTASGNLVYIGTETLNLGVYAGRVGTFTAIVFDGKHRYRFGAGNVSGTVGSNAYFTIGANGVLVPAASAPSTNGALYFTLDGTGSATEGNVASSTYYDVVAHTAVA